jgi:hypothetical protein
VVFAGRIGSEIMRKRCTRCDELKILTDFHKNYDGTFGRGHRCKLCVRQYKQENPHVAKDSYKRCGERNRLKHEMHGFPIAGVKRCPMCKKIKELVDFSKSFTRRDGRQSYCRDCVRGYNDDHQDAKKAYDKQYYLKNKEAKKARERGRYLRKKANISGEQSIDRSIVRDVKECFHGIWGGEDLGICGICRAA